MVAFHHFLCLRVGAVNYVQYYHALSMVFSNNSLFWNIALRDFTEKQIKWKIYYDKR